MLALEAIRDELHRLGIVPGTCQECRPLAANSPAQVAAEAQFLQRYRGAPLLPRLQYTDPAHRYLVYAYLPGEDAGRFLLGLIPRLSNKCKSSFKCA